MIKKLISTIILTIFIQFGFAQSLDKNKLDNYFKDLSASNKFMGSVAILVNDKVIYTNAIGTADIEANHKADKNTKYRIGSISKTFTSTLILKAIEEKKLSLDTKISKFFPSLKNADKITVGNLLNHRSGIHNFTNNSDYLEWNTEKKSEQEMLQIIEKSGSDFEPNTKAEYSNSNYLLLSYILQKIYKKPYSAVLNEKIIKPIGLKNTYLSDKINTKNNESNSYKFFENWEKQSETDISIPLGAGAISATPSDITVFANALFSGKILSENSLKLMMTIQDNYGNGLFQMSFGDKISYGHTGGIDGFSSAFGYFPKEKIAIAVTSNANNYNINDVSLTLLKAVFNQPFEIPNFKGYQLTSEELDKYLGTYSSKEIPLKISITKNGNVLMAQATGQSAFSLDATEKDKFRFDQAGIKLDFNPTNKTMILKQGGGIFTFTKE